MKYKIDPELEKCLPPLDEETYQGIKKSLTENGYDKAFPVVIWEGHDIIVDGHHRSKACLELGIDPVTVEHSFESLDDAILYALEHQDNRRNQTVTQKALNGVKRKLVSEKIAARLRISPGINQYTERSSEDLHATTGRASEHVAKLVGVSSRTIDHVSAVLSKGVPELECMMRDNELAADTANIFVQAIPKEQQSEIVLGGPDAIRKCVRDLRAAATDAKKDLRFQEEQAAIKQDVKEYHAVQKEKFGGATYACGLSSISEMWCNSCKCAFDVFKPHQATVCPACNGGDIGKRDEMWYPGKKVV